MKDVLDEMITVAGGCCGAIAGVSAPGLTVEELAREYGLSEDPSCYLTADAVAVRRLLTVILHYDPIHGHELLTLAKATRLADRFVTALAKLDPRYLTNGAFPPLAMPIQRPFGWPGECKPVTDSLIDAGVLAFTSRFTLCFWVAHDD